MKKVLKPKTSHEVLPSFGKAKVHRFVLPNGLRLFVQESKLAPIFSYQTWYDVGSRDEEPGLSGIAHLFEHMMFKETKNMRQGVFDKTMESNGARDLNAFTSTDYTAYVQSLPIEALDLVAKLESERMCHLLLTKKQFESEREVVHNERRQRNENNPEGQMFEELQKLAFKVHPYGRPVIGFEEDLNRMTTADCEKFYGEFYTPNNAVISVVGDVKPEKVLAIITKHYGKVAPSKITRPEIQVEPEQREEKVLNMSLNVQVEKAYMAYKIPIADHPDQTPISVLAAILSTGRSSRLYRALVDKGVTIDIGAGANPGKDAGLFYVTFSAQAGKKASDAIKAIDDEFATIMNKPISEEELRRAKNKLQTEFFMGLGTNSARANFVAQNEIVLGDYKKAVRALEELEEVTAEDVMRVTKSYFQKTNRSMVIGKPV